MRTATRVAAVVAGALLSLTAPATALAAASDAREATTVPWQAGHETATTQGQRWIEQPSTLVLSGKVATSGDSCFSVWTRFANDFIPGVPRKHAEMCGPGTADVSVRQPYRPTTTGSIAVCRGTVDTKDCGPWQNITSWPVKPK